MKLIDKSKIKLLPGGPGVYFFKKGELFLYIGKASNIRERVKSHFQRPVFRDGLFIGDVEKIGYAKTNSEIEALVLEASLIKKFQPRFNVEWRDDKNYFYLAISQEDYPMVFITHQPLGRARIKNQELRIKNKKIHNSLFVIRNSKFKYIGPFVDGRALKQALKVLRRVFPYRTCRLIPKKPCLWYELNRCAGPCALKSAKTLLQSSRVLAQKEQELKKTCRKNVKNLVKILQGKKTLVLKNLKKEMQLASRAQNFEKAAKLRDQATALKSILEHSRLSAKIYPGSQGLQNWPAAETALRKLFSLKKKIKRIEGYDVSNIQGYQATGSMVVFEDGQPKKEHYRKFRVKISGKSNDTAMLKEVLERRFGHYKWKLPDLILIDGGVGQLSAALQIKNQKSKIKNTNQKSKIKRIKFAAIVKRKNELYIENKKSSFLLKELPQDVSNLILRVRDESHRFAISYHKKLRKRVLFGN